MRMGTRKAVAALLPIALLTIGLVACGSGGGEVSTVQPPPLSASTADHLAKLSDRIAAHLDAGETCGAAHAADDLEAAVQDADLSATLRPGIEEVASRLVDEVNCPPPPAPPPPAPKPQKEKKPKQEDGQRSQGKGKGKGKGPKPPGHGGKLPPGQAKLKGELG